MPRGPRASLWFGPPSDVPKTFFRFLRSPPILMAAHSPRVSTTLSPAPPPHPFPKTPLLATLANSQPLLTPLRPPHTP